MSVFRMMTASTLVLIAFFLPIGSRGEPLPESTLARALRSSTVRIGYANEAPFAYMDVFSGQVTGEAPEVARVVLAGMGIRHIVPVLTEFGALIPGLKAGRFDIIAAGMYILPARCQQVLFSNPSYSADETLLVTKSGTPTPIRDYSDLVSNPALQVGVVAGTVEAQALQAAGLPRRREFIFPDNPSAAEGLLANRIDVFAVNAPAARDLIRRANSEGMAQEGGFQPILPGGQRLRGFGAFAFRRGDSDFVAAFNRGLAAYIGSPAHLRLITPFGFTADELPGKATADSLCTRIP